MANIKLSSHNWETSGIYDLTQAKTQRQINSDTNTALNTLNTTISKEILYFANQTVSVASSAQIMQIPSSGTNSNITTDTVVLECYFANPEYITSDVTWTSYDGYIAFSGTCITATTANVVLGNKNN